MLHELLLALSGHHSPLFENAKDGASATFLAQLASDSEKALLRSIARLGALHLDTRTRATQASSSHSSAICRAVCSAIVATHLRRFQEKILRVEESILHDDPDYVGAYDIVPLSSVARAFDGWERILEWLNEIVLYIHPEPVSEDEDARIMRSGAQLIDRLRLEAQTGFLDLEAVILDLVRVAESVWVRQLATWVLYGRLPAPGAGDFFVQRVEDNGSPAAATYKVKMSLAPKFVTPATCKSILFIGKSLNHIHEQGHRTQAPGAERLETGFMFSGHSSLLSALQHPISSSDLSNAIASVRSSLEV
jgi:hypothetical protein